MSRYLTAMEKAALQAGKRLARDFGEVENLQVSIKGPRDFVTSADLRSEKTIISILQESFPDFGIISEESGVSEGSAKFKFIIDPVDGTQNLMHGLPFFCISIALAEETYKGLEVKAAVVYNPITYELFLAEAGEGATCNNKRLNVSGRQEYKEALFSCYVNKCDSKMRQADTSFINNNDFQIRIYGAAALELAYVAAGKIDGLWHRNLKIWDIAAGALLVKEARGVVKDFQGEEKYLENGSIIACNNKLYKQISPLIEKHYK